jgi:radical SAM protein with 4Fe4S-binding SPASM domain
MHDHRQGTWPVRTSDSDRKLPSNLYLETTNRCNLKCKGCIQHRGSWEPARDLSLEELIAICDQLPVLDRVALHGIGEPLLNNALPDMIRHLKGRNAYVFFNSNGILLNARCQHQLVDAGLDELRISLDAASPEKYRSMRNSDQFDCIVGNVRAFSERIHSLRTLGPRLSIWCLGTRDNIFELPRLVRLAASLGVKEVYLQRLVYFQDHEGHGLAKSEKTIMDSDLGVAEVINASMHAAAQSGVQLNASGLGDPLASLRTKAGSPTPWKKCYRPTTLMYITANGNVLPCCIAPFATSDYESILLGNAFKKPLAEIWRGPRYSLFRREHQTRTPPKCCRGCGILWSL